MTWQNYQLDPMILKVTEDTTLWRAEKGVIEVKKDTLALPLRRDDQRRGYVFHGQGKLLLDAIVETEEGAVGKAVEKEISEPFIMLGEPEELQQHFKTANKDDLKKVGYENEQKLVAKAEELCNNFLGRQRIHACHCSSWDHGLVFAFSNEADEFDVLVTKGSKVVFKALGIVFVSSKNKSVLKSRDAVAVSHNGRLVVAKA